MFDALGWALEKILGQDGDNGIMNTALCIGAIVTPYVGGALAIGVAGGAAYYLYENYHNHEHAE